MSLKKTIARLVVLGAMISIGLTPAVAADVSLLNVSYDPTRELYQDFRRHGRCGGHAGGVFPHAARDQYLAMVVA